MKKNIENNTFYEGTINLAADEDKRYDELISMADRKPGEKKEFIDMLAWFRGKDFLKGSSGGSKWSSKEIQNQYRNEPYRFVHEFIQNADDCKYKPYIMPSLKIFFGDNYMVFEYNELGFEVKDIDSLCRVGESNKKISEEEIYNNNELRKYIFSNVQTGEKGIGFKSVFGVSKKVFIESNGYKFYLEEEKSTVPISFENINDELKRLSIEKEFEKVTEGTRIILTDIEDSFQIDTAIEEIKTKYLSCDNILGKNILLFTKNIRKIKIDEDEYFLEEDISNADFGEELEMDRSHSNILEGIKSKEGKLCENIVYDITLNMNGESVKLKKYTSMVIFDEDIVKNRYSELNKPQARNISIVFALDNNVNGSIYTTLPLSHKLNIPLAIDAPFKLNTNRTEIDKNIAKDWNEYISKLIFDEKGLLERAFISVREEINDITEFLRGTSNVFGAADCNEEFYVNLKEKIEKYPIFKGVKEGWLRLNELCILEEFIYEFPELNTLFEKLNSGKKLANKKYVEKLGYEYIYDWEKYFENYFNEYLDSDVIKDSKEKREKIVEIIENNYDEFDEGNLKKIKIFEYKLLNENGNEEEVRGTLGEEFWIDDFGESIEVNFEGRISFKNYRLISSSNLSEYNHENLISLLNLKDSSEFIQDLNDKASNIRNIDECVDFLHICFYYNIKGLKISFLKQCCVLEELDDEKNLFRDAGLLNIIEQQTLEKLLELSNREINNSNEIKKIVDNLIEYGLRRGNEFFDINSDYIKLDAKSIDLLKKSTDTKAIKSIENEYNKIPEENKKPLKIEFDYEMSEDVKKYIIKNEIIKEYVLKEFCKKALESSSAEAEMMLWALNRLDKNYGDYKEITLEIEFEKAKELTIKTKKNEEENDTKATLEFVVNRIMREHKMEKLKILYSENELKEYNDSEFNEAIKLFYKQDKNTFTEKEYYTACLGEGTYIFDKEKVILNINDTGKCLEEYVKNTSGKDDFKNYIAYIQRDKSFKIENPESIDAAKKYIEELNGFRVLNYKTSLTDIGRLIDQLNDSNDKPQNYVLYEILQNINDARKENVEKCCEVADVTFTFKENIMRVEYFEKGFTAHDVYNITSLSAISKTDEETGEKGIGFKTIFSIFDKVEIHSGFFHFSLSNGKENDPKFIVPTWVDTEEEYINRTEMIFTLKGNKNFESVKKQLEDIKTFLFLKNISTIKIDSNELIDIEKYRDDSYYKYTKELNNIESFNIEIMKLRDKWKLKSEEELNGIRGKLAVEIYISRNLKNENKCGRIYTTLPTEQKINDFVYLNVPFELTTGRNKVRDDSEYNKELRKIIFGNDGIYKEAMEKFAKEDEIKNNLIKYLVNGDEEFVSLDLIKSIKFLENYENNDLIPIKEAYIIPGLLYELIKKYEQSWENISELKRDKPEMKIVKIEFSCENGQAKLEAFINTSLFDRPEYKDNEFITLFEKLYNEPKSSFDKNKPLHQFLKETLWEEIKDKNESELSVFYPLHIFPYKTENGIVLSRYEPQKWYQIKNDKYKEYYSTESYKILDENYEVVSSFRFGKNINDFHENIIIDYIKIEMNKIEEFSEKWWSKAREIFNLREKMNEGEVNG